MPASKKDHYIWRALLVLSIGTLLVFSLIWLITTGAITGLEEHILLFFRDPSALANPLGPVAVEETLRDITALGSTLVTTLLTVYVVAFLYLSQKPEKALFLALAVILGVAYVFLIKLGFDRPRPDVVPQLMRSLSPSFPSGHAATSAIVYLLFADAISRSTASKSLRVFTYGFAILITTAVGISRLYLGVHWPSDVLGGWIIGVSWVLTCLVVEKGLMRNEQ